MAVRPVISSPYLSYSSFFTTNEVTFYVPNISFLSKGVRLSITHHLKKYAEQAIWLYLNSFNTHQCKPGDKLGFRRQRAWILLEFWKCRSLISPQFNPWSHPVLRCPIHLAQSFIFLFENGLQSDRMTFRFCCSIKEGQIYYASALFLFGSFSFFFLSST